MGKMLDLSVAGNRFPAYLAEPTGEVKGGIIVIHEIWGLADHIKDVTDRLAAEGYVALAPDLFSDTGIEKLVSHDLMEGLFDPERRAAVQPKLRDITAPIHVPEFADQTKTKLQECFTYLAKDTAAKDNIAVTGFCFGGSYSWQLATIEPRLKAAIPFYGQGMLDESLLKQIKCPILAFYGENDENLMAQLPELKQKTTAAGVDFQAVVYPDCGHAFFNDTNRFTYNAAAATDAWKRLLDLLAANLA